MSTKDMTTVLGRVAVTTCYVIVGFASRRFGLLRREDGEVMLTFVVNVTLPAMLLHTLVNTRALFGPGVPLVMLCSVFATVLVAGAGALVYRRTPAYEKGLLTGALCGANVSTFALPFVEAVWGMEGLRLAALFDVPNLVVVFALGAAVFAFHQRKARLHAKSAAARHDDGGVYHGEWSSVGESKQGVGVYEYPSGASYEGQWNNNQKEGFGVYKFAKGGSYAGGFKRGSFHGTGLRFMRSGGVKSGRFQDGDFVEALSLKAADDATVAATTMAKKARAKAAVSKTTETHGAFWTRVVLKTLSFPPVVAISVVVFLTATGQNLPALVTQVLNPLALANSPLVLLSLGVLFTPRLPKPRARTLVYFLVTKFATALLAAALIALAVPVSENTSIRFILPALALMPVPFVVVKHAIDYENDAQLADAMVSYSQLVSSFFVVLLGVASGSTWLAGAPVWALPALLLGLGAVVLGLGVVADRVLAPARIVVKPKTQKTQKGEGKADSGGSGMDITLAPDSGGGAGPASLGPSAAAASGSRGTSSLGFRKQTPFLKSRRTDGKRTGLGITPGACNRVPLPRACASGRAKRVPGAAHARISVSTNSKSKLAKPVFAATKIPVMC